MEIITKLQYRQVWNGSTRTWGLPKRLVGKKERKLKDRTVWVEDWQVVNNLTSLKAKWGYAGAINRIRRVYDGRQDQEGRHIWKTYRKERKYPRRATKSPKSVVVFVTCYRQTYGFSRSL